MLQKTRKNKIFEFLTLISMIIGIVIGTGEFIKNDNEHPGHILYETHNNVIMALSIWVIIGISCIFMIIGFAEIASSTAKKGNGTTSNWAKLFIGRKCASFISIYWVFIYLPIIYTLFSIMAIQFLLSSFGLDKSNAITHLSAISASTYLLGGIAIFLFFTLLNSLSQKAGKHVQIIGTFLKIIPFVLILFIAFIPSWNHTANSGGNAFNHDNKEWSVSAFFLTTGPILFSFDGFILASNLQKETKNKQLVYSSLIIGMVVIVLVYILEAVALFVGSSNGNVLTLFQNAFGSEKVAVAFNLMIVFAILIGLNGVTVGGARYIVSDTSIGLLASFNKKINFKRSGLIQMFIGAIWFLILILLGLVIKNKDGTFAPDIYADIMSNIVVEFAFIIYILLIFAGVVNRFTKKVKTNKLKFMPFFAIVGGTIISIFTITSLVLTIIAHTSTTDILTRYIMIGVIVLNILIFFINEYFLIKYKIKEPEEKINKEEILIQNEEQSFSELELK